MAEGSGWTTRIAMLPLRAVEPPMRLLQRGLGERGMPYVFLLPNAVFFGLFVFLPFGIDIVYSVTGGTSLFPGQRPFVGAQQYGYLLDCHSFLHPDSCREDRFWRGLANTAIFTVLQVAAMVIVSLATALVLNRKIRARGFFRAVFFFPVLLSPVVVALIWKWILQRDGLLNALVMALGGGRTLFLADPHWAMFWVIFITIWAHMGFYTLILLAGLQAIPADLYEAAAMDRTPAARIFWRITLPLLWPNLIVVLVLALIRGVQTFDEVYVLTGGGPGSATLMVVQYIYETAFASQAQNFGLAAAASVLLGALLFLAHPRAARRRAPAGNVKPVRLLTSRRMPGGAVHWTDLASYLYLACGVLLMFVPVLWLVLSSFKTPAGLLEFPPSLLPVSQVEVAVPGHADQLPLFKVTLPDGTVRDMAQLRRIGLQAQMVDPADPAKVVRVPVDRREPVRALSFATGNYTEPLRQFDFARFLGNSVFVTIVATLITLLINSMAAYGLSIYEFRGKGFAMLLVIGTLMIPITIVLVPLYLVVTRLGLANSLWAVILPGAATPTGVFLLRQYMLTLPRDLIEAARMDKASEWQIYWRIVMPLTLPALAVLTIFSIMWRWNEFLWPLAVLTKTENYTLQIGLNAFQGELQTQWHYLLAMTVVTLLPVTLVFVFLQRFITTGIGATGMK